MIPVIEKLHYAEYNEVIFDKQNVDYAERTK
jgi:hypothetical protein